MPEVVISASAQSDLRRNVSWWGEHRSMAEAEAWYVTILEKIYSLEQMPERCPMSREAKPLKMEIRHLLFGMGTKHTHRVLFTIDGSVVNVLRVLNTRQATIEDPRDLS